MERKHILQTIGLFGIVGIGLGLSGYITLDFMQATFVQDTEADSFMRGIGQLMVLLAALQTSFVTFLLGSVVATATGLSNARASGSLRSSILGSGVAATIGFPIMVSVAIAIMLLALDLGGGGGGGGSQQVAPGIDWLDVGISLATLCVPTGLVGAGAGFVGYNLHDNQ